MFSEGIVIIRYHGMPLIRCNGSGSHFLLFHQSIQKLWALVVLFSVAAICTYLVAKTQYEDL
jgi:hypothetical protein